MAHGSTAAHRRVMADRLLGGRKSKDCDVWKSLMMLIVDEVDDNLVDSD